MGQLLQTEQPAAIRGMPSPIFLDSEDLERTDDILTRVRCSSNLILLLTKGVLTRPWCLIEITAAIQDGVQVIPVEVSKPGNEFTIPDEYFYLQLATGALLTSEANEVVREAGLELSEVAASVRQVFKRIVLPYSPHRPASHRRPELLKVLRACRTRKAAVSARSSLRSSGNSSMSGDVSRLSYDWAPNGSVGSSTTGTTPTIDMV